MKKIYAGNLPFRATDSDVRALFATYGKVLGVDIIKHKDTGRPKGFGFVEMENDSEALKAITALNGKEMNGRPLKINEAEERQKRG